MMKMVIFLLLLLRFGSTPCAPTHSDGASLAAKSTMGGVNGQIGSDRGQIINTVTKPINDD